MVPVSQRQALLSSSVLLDNGVKKGWMLRGRGQFAAALFGDDGMRWWGAGDWDGEPWDRVWPADSGLGCRVRAGLFLSHSECEPWKQRWPGVCWTRLLLTRCWEVSKVFEPAESYWQFEVSQDGSSYITEVGKMLQIRTALPTTGSPQLTSMR